MLCARITKPAAVNENSKKELINQNALIAVQFHNISNSDLEDDSGDDSDEDEDDLPNILPYFLAPNSRTHLNNPIKKNEIRRFI